MSVIIRYHLHAILQNDYTSYMKMSQCLMKISQQGSEVFFCHMFFILPNLLNLKLAMTQIESYFQFSVACTFRFCIGKCL